MAGSTGVDASAGVTLSGWPHVAQSIATILTTRIGARVMRRDFGSDLMSLVDAPISDRVVLAMFVAAATALNRWEPRFSLDRVAIAAAGAEGGILLVLSGTYFPRGHLGDFNVQEDAQTRVVVSQ
ncbi:GPW/gp25 family protein [Breoghania sp. L-A4]|uniref:GPW/gp25 family protein n=1 Tax=Breoghania sp. L-A4 TaxID=2304600 RepID=UPI000E359769|nr:GPW/gp25 family protein [Breoghania sp. L-A4]AXS39267.1 baseplate assembly protein [Breoghania sp. L-A4]